MRRDHLLMGLTRNLGSQRIKVKMANTVPARSKIDKKFTWNSESVFKSTEAWEKEIKQIIEDISRIKMYQGRLAEDPSVLLEAFSVAHDLVSRGQVAFMYAGFSYAVDTT